LSRVLLRDPVDENGAAAGPLALYAAQHWVTHAQVENVASSIRDGMECLFDPDRPYFSAWVQLYDVNYRTWGPDQELKIQPGATPLYYATFCKFHEIVGHLALKYPQYTKAIGGDAGTALHAASLEGHVEVVRSLLKFGVDVDARGRWGQSPLRFAILRRHLNIVQCLVDNGADPNFRDVCHMTPLGHAARRGHLKIVRVLLEHNADVNSQDEDGLTPMHDVFLRGYPEGDYPQIVRLLLERGANPNARNNKRQTPMHLVLSSAREEFSPEWVESSSWRLEVAGILLAHGADADAKDEEGRTPMEVVLAKGRTELVQLLSEYCPK